MREYVAYYRVSTDKQGASGLGLEAQRNAVSQYIREGANVLEYIEVESGKRIINRPKLIEAIAECKKRKAILVIAKLDRLARSVHFISGLMESKVEFLAVDNPNANKLMVHMLAAFAEHERDMISLRTKEALAMAKRRGVKLGSPNPSNGAKAVKDHALAFNAPAKAIIEQMHKSGYTLVQIAKHLADTGIMTRNGGKWYPSSVRNILMR